MRRAVAVEQPERCLAGAGQHVFRWIEFEYPNCRFGGASVSASAYAFAIASASAVAFASARRFCFRSRSRFRFRTY